MKLIFAGTPAFAAQALEALIAAGHVVCCALTKPDRPAGRRLHALASPVKLLAIRHGIRVLQPVSLRDAVIRDELRAMASDVMVVAAYGLILPQAVLDIPKSGALNIHASLLPRWRGAAPIQRALLAGDADTGITIMRMDAGLDTGPMLLRESCAIGTEDDAGSLRDRLARLGARLIVTALERLQEGNLVEQPQPQDGVTYARKIEKAEARIDWRLPAPALSRLVRAFSPLPGAVTMLDGREIKIWRVRESIAAPASPGCGLHGEIRAVSDVAVRVACGSGELDLMELQRPGGKRLPIAEFLRGFPLSKGARFDS